MKKSSKLGHDYSTATVELNRLQEKLQRATSDLARITSDEESSSKKTAELAEALAVERQLRKRAESHEEGERRERTAACAQLIAMTQAHRQREERFTEDLAALKQDHSQQIEGMDRKFGDQMEMTLKEQERAVTLEGEAKQLRMMLEEQRTNSEELEMLAKKNGEMVALKHRMSQAAQLHEDAFHSKNGRIAELEAKIREGETQRRGLHNLVQELRGNVRVFARVRPFLPGDNAEADAPLRTFQLHQDQTGMTIVKPGEKTRDSETQFRFDRNFEPSSSQETVFQEVSEFVQSALDGYQVCLFSYGQTGSGKTHTMQGSREGPLRGIIPRAIEQVGKYKATLEKQGWKYSIEVTFVEIYNEQIRDLLRTSKKPTSHDIRTDPKSGKPYISEIRRWSVDPEDASTIDEIMELAASQRAVESTDMNAQSSRSHSIFTLHLKADHNNGSFLKGALNLVDLAGSERLSRSNATGERLREAQSINKSLSCLSDVFNAISKKASHIPFRNSKLTHILSPALSGDGKTLMMVNLSPTDASYHESLCSLRFASTVNKCELGRPKRQVRQGGNSDKPKRSKHT